MRKDFYKDLLMTFAMIGVGTVLVFLIACALFALMPI